MDSIAREKLQVQMLGREANVEAGGENDPLLVTEGQSQLGARRAASPHSAQAHFQNPPGNSAVSASPPLVADVMNTRQFRPYQRAHSSSSVPEVTFAPNTAYGHPPKIVATFTRSSSVIATPEGEVDEDDMEARVPRFSQLLPDMDGGDTASAGEGSPDREEAQEARRPDETSGTTQQLRSPNQRLLPRVTPGQGRLYQPVQHRAPPAPNQPDHHIMNLKEQQLRESLTSATSSSLTSQLKFPSDVSETEALKTNWPEELEDSESSQQETTLKTQLSPIDDSDFSGAAHAGRKLGKAVEPSSNEETQQKKRAGEEQGDTSLERKRVQAARDRRRMASGGSTNSNSSRGSTQERHRNLSSGSADKTGTAATTAVKVAHPSPGVPFKEGEEVRQGLGDQSPNSDKEEDTDQTEQKQVSRDDETSPGSSIRSSDDSPTRVRPAMALLTGRP